MWNRKIKRKRGRKGEREKGRKGEREKGRKGERERAERQKDRKEKKRDIKRQRQDYDGMMFYLYSEHIKKVSKLKIVLDSHIRVQKN